jgi:hypothetical protein
MIARATALPRHGRRPWLNVFLLLVGLILLMSFYRAWTLFESGLNLYLDEAQYWGWSQALAWGYYSKPPMIAALIAGTTALFGDSELAVKSGALILYPLTTLLLYALSLRMYGARVAFWTALLFFTLPGIAFSSLIISTDVPLFFFWTAALYCLWRALESGDWHWWGLLGLACGLGLLSKYTMAIFGVSALAYVASSPAHRAVLASPKPYAAMAIAALLLLPNLLWNADHGWPTLTHTVAISNLQRGPALHWAELGEFVSGQAGIFGPLLFIALLWRTLWISRWWKRPSERYLALFTLPFLLIISLQALLGRANANWAAMTYAAGSLWMASWLLGRGHRALLVASIALHLLVAALAYHYHDLMHLSGVPLAGRAKPAECWRALRGSDPTAHCPDFYKRVQGWDHLGRAVQARLQEHPGSLLLAHERDTMSEMLYYARPESAAAVMWNPDGSVHNHYELATRLDGKGNANFVFISRDAALPKGMRESFLDSRDLGSISIPIAKDYALRYHLSYLKGYMGYPLWLQAPSAPSAASSSKN